MTGNSASEEIGLLLAAVSALRARLPENWGVNTQGTRTSEPDTVDGTIVLTAPDGTVARFAAEAKRTVTPRAVPALLPRLARPASLFGDAQPLVVSPWLSPRTRERLEAEGVNYVDLTGNVRVQLDRPALFVSSIGAMRDPRPAAQGTARVRGPKAGRLIRMLVDTQPPYGVRELAEAARLAPGYVSRMLDTLDREALIDRSRRGAVESVDVPALVRRWAENYDVLKANRVETFIARAGAAEAYAALAGLGSSSRVAVTGSFAAVRIAPVAAPALLLAYCDDVPETARSLGLLPADQGADVILLEPFDDVVWEGLRRGDAVDAVAPSQVAADCLTGTGRMPAEGEAVLSWMAQHEGSWRRQELQPLGATPERRMPRP